MAANAARPAVNQNVKAQQNQGQGQGQNGNVRRAEAQQVVNFQQLSYDVAGVFLDLMFDDPNKKNN